MTNWQKLKYEFIAGKTLIEIAKENSLSLETVKSRHRLENWSQARKDFERKLNEKLTNKLAEAKADELFDEIENLKLLIKKAEKELPHAEISSKEGLIRAINELYKTLGTYTGKTVQKNETNANVTMPIPILGNMVCHVPE